MKYRRYYPKGSHHKYVQSDEQFEETIKQIGFDEAVERDNAQMEIIPESDEEMKQMFFDSCDRVQRNPSFYLDNLDKIPTFTAQISKIYPVMKK